MYTLANSTLLDTSISFFFKFPIITVFPMHDVLYILKYYGGEMPRRARDLQNV